MLPAIRVENLSKVYQLGEFSTGTLSQDLQRWWLRMRGRDDIFHSIGETNDRTVKGKSNFVWSLKNLNFEVEQGDVIGIIGQNGAGKSTLLKILSRVTTPTTGSVKIKGRIASLLEVGTGFHPELTGRENIFLNGAILGMRKQEIKDKYDEIVDFSGVERFIDTPVKRYSSGMYVRLAFAVAAHLEPEILIIDEVLAVGDGEFQKKCLGKMKDVSTNEGRTILFVSHNMIAIKNLCKQVIYLRNGTTQAFGPTEEIINNYLSHNVNSSMKQAFSHADVAPGNENVKIKRIEICPVLKNINDPITVNTDIDIEFEFWNNVTDKEINLSLMLYTMADECIFNVGTPAKILSAGVHSGVCRIPGKLLNDGTFKISMMIVGEKSYSLFFYENAVSFEVHESRELTGWHGKWSGYVRPQLDFKLE